jgi:hypothetical protein
MGVATVAIIVSYLAGADGFSGLVVMFWVVAFAWNAYWWLFRVVNSLSVRGGMLEWKAPLRGGHVAVAGLTAIRPMKLIPSVVVIEHQAGRPLLVMPGKGLPALAAEIEAARSDLPMRLGPWSQLVQKVPGRSAWRGDD